jgi:hypothetical protein
MERVMGIEPTFSAWEADVLPLNYTRSEMHVPGDSHQHLRCDTPTARRIATFFTKAFAFRNRFYCLEGHSQRTLLGRPKSPKKAPRLDGILTLPGGVS